MVGKASRRKDYRFEHQVQQMARASGHDCRRIPLSGSAPGWAGDLLLNGRAFEAKRRATGFRVLYRWLEGRYGLILSADRRPALVVLRLEDYLTMGARPKSLGRGFGKAQTTSSSEPEEEGP